MKIAYAFSESLRIEDMEELIKSMFGAMCRSYGEQKPVLEHEVNEAMDSMRDMGVIQDD